MSSCCCVSCTDLPVSAAKAQTRDDDTCGSGAAAAAAAAAVSVVATAESVNQCAGAEVVGSIRAKGEAGMSGETCVGNKAGGLMAVVIKRGVEATNSGDRPSRIEGSVAKGGVAGSAWDRETTPGMLMLGPTIDASELKKQQGALDLLTEI